MRTGRSRRTDVTTASERAALAKLEADFKREASKRDEAESKVKELEAVLASLQSDLTARK